MNRLIIVSILLFTAHSVKAQSYNQLLIDIKAKKDSLTTVYQNGDSITKYKVLEQAEDLLYNQLIDNVFPSWYGTEWDFDGYTNTPKKGKVACGYFVSTPLKHVGFNLNRYKLAQKYSHAIAKTLCKDIQMVKNNDIEKLIKYVNSKPNQLYVLGLDNHVGFISKESTGIYFIHSSYVDPVIVVKEKASESEALMSSDLYVLGHFTTNFEVIKKWLLSETIFIKSQ